MLYHIENRKKTISTSYFQRLMPAPHIHSHLELIYMEKGKSLVHVDNEEILIEEGDLFLAFPNQIHYYQDCSPVNGYLIIFAVDLFKEFRDLFLSQRPIVPVIRCSQLPSDICTLLELIEAKNREDSFFEKTVAKGYLLALLAKVLPLFELTSACASHDSIKNVLKYCSDNYKEPITLDRVSEELHLNKYYISHIFNERMNMSFTEFVNRLRLENACSLLEKGTSITEIALVSGFSSVRTFNRVFQKELNMTPRDYLKQKIRTPLEEINSTGETKQTVRLE